MRVCMYVVLEIKGVLVIDPRHVCCLCHQLWCRSFFYKGYAFSRENISMHLLALPYNVHMFYVLERIYNK